MSKLHFEDLYPPEYYYEFPEYDCRIAVSKLCDARDTLALAGLALSYIDERDTDDMQKLFVRSIYMRYVIQDLSNSFDLLMQSPWFFYRIWKEFNKDGSLYSKKDKQLKNNRQIKRNKDGWVYKAEKNCNKEKVTKYLEKESNPLYSKINEFWENYMDKGEKKFTVRSLCNSLKHNHALEFEELYVPYDFKMKIGGTEKNYRNSGLVLKFRQNILDCSDNKLEVGVVKTEYSDDLAVDFEYTNGEYFRYEDCSHKNDRVKMDEVYRQCKSCYNALVGLLDDIYKDIQPQLKILDNFVGADGKPNIRTNGTISLNDYFSFA